MPFLIGGMNVNDMEFIATLKEKRNACGYSQTRLAQELHISRQNLNEIENGKTVEPVRKCNIYFSIILIIVTAHNLSL